MPPCLFNGHAEYTTRNAGLDESQAGIKIAGRNISKLRYPDDATLMAESEEELKSLSMRRESGKVRLKINIQKTKIMASGSITLWETDGGKVETVTDFTFLGSKITVDGGCSHEIKRYLLLGKKGISNVDSVLKSKDITLLTKVVIVQSLSHVQLFVTLWTTAHQASLFFTISWSLPKLLSIESVMPSYHLNE